MGKRKFIKPDDSDSEYEWEEAAPKKCKSPEVKKNDNELSSFLNLYTTNSNKDNRKQEKQQEQEAEEKRLKDRMVVQCEVESQKLDNNWLRRVHRRAEEESTATGVDMITVLRERYDEKTINQMMKLCGSSKPRQHKSSSINHSHYRQSQPQTDIEDPSKEVEERYVTNTDLNEASAALIKAELSGNTHKLTKLKKRLEILREAQKRNLKIRLTKSKKEIMTNKSVMIEKVLKSGKMVPYVETGNKFQEGVGRMVREENALNGDDSDWMFVNAAARNRGREKNSDEVTEREYSIHSSHGDKSGKTNQTAAVIAAQKRRAAQVSNCRHCYSNLPKHLVLSKGDYFCLAVPPCLGLTVGHWQLMPLAHIAACSRLDDDAIDELLMFKRQLRQFCREQLPRGTELTFLETVIGLDDNPHTVIDVVPSVISAESDVSTRFVFKKAMEEAQSEWSAHRRLMNVQGGDLRRTVPKELPYFAVEFDDGDGYVIVIGDERKMEAGFGLNVVGSLLDLSVIEVRSRRVRTLGEQSAAVIEAEKMWRRYDRWRRDDDESDSE